MMRNLLEMRGLVKGCAALALAGALAGLAGCASKGVLEKDAPGLSDSFSVATDSDSAYRRALEYVRVCHKSRPHPYGQAYDAIRDGDLAPDDSVFGVFDTQRSTEKLKPRDMGRIRVFKVGEEARILELIEAKNAPLGSGPVTSQVTVRVLGTGLWDKAELAAARQSILSATPTCRPLE